ncbi:ABC transporter permease [Methyloparacoccus murrellii]
MSRTSGTVMGWLWLIAQPGLQVLAFWFLLELVLKVQSPGPVAFVEYFLVAMIPWLLINEVMSRSLGVLTEYSALYQRTLFPVKILPLLPIVMALVIFGPVLLLISGLFAGIVGALLATIMLLLLVLWLIPFAYLLAVIGLFFKESRQILPFLLTVLMYFTPILYQPVSLPEAFRPLLVWNPLAGIVALFQHYINQIPLQSDDILLPCAYWMILIVPSFLLFHKAEPYMREEL